jgi:hypothetical protein
MEKECPVLKFWISEKAHSTAYLAWNTTIITITTAITTTTTTITTITAANNNNNK